MGVELYVFNRTVKYNLLLMIVQRKNKEMFARRVGLRWLVARP